MNLIEALQTKNVLTENGMPTHSTSLSPHVDFFFMGGAMRGAEEQRIVSLFSKAFTTEPLTAMKLLFWVRDVRGGAGERRVFRTIVQHLLKEKSTRDALVKNIALIPEYGRWDDVLELIGTPLEDEAISLIRQALNDKNGLCAKWMPRKGAVAAHLRTKLEMTPKQYRKTLVALTKVVEQQMCANQWTSIEYGKVPSLASARYQKAFGRHDSDGYAKYLLSLQKGEAKINAGAVYPYDIVKSLNAGNAEIANEQWKALPNYLEGATERILTVVDTSGSMGSRVSQTSTVTCLDVAVSLGLYLSERMPGPFKNAFITFSGRPTLQVLSGSLLQRYNQLKRADWDMNTNLEAVFSTILTSAVKYRVSPDEMPTQVLILSDMEFDRCTRQPGDSAMDMIKRKYAEAGYEVPSVVFWNIQSRQNNVPVKYNTKGTALVSGFSPAIIKSVMRGVESPEQVMLYTLSQPRYLPITA